MPTIPDLSKRLFKNLVNSSDGQYDELKSFVKLFDEINYDKDKGFKIIENITTTIFSKQFYIDFYEKEKYTRLKWQLLFYMFDNLKDYNVDESLKDVLNKFLRLVSFETQYGGNCGKTLLVTFNYDLLVDKFIEENAIQNQIYRVEYGIKLNEYSTYFLEPTPPFRYPVQFLKMHGSFNWFQAKGSQNYDINSIYVVNPDDINYFIHQKDLPVFIPMAHAKELFLHGTLYNTLWVKFNYYLNQAKEVYFIGYGFPQTDINNLLYFYQFKDKIKNIVVFYPSDNDSDFERLRKVFGNIVINQDAKGYLNQNYKKFCRIKD